MQKFMNHLVITILHVAVAKTEVNCTIRSPWKLGGIKEPLSPAKENYFAPTYMFKTQAVIRHM